MKRKIAQNDTATSAESAIHQVLAAEDQARQAVRSCAQEAENILRDARATAKRIVERADRRIGYIHHRTSAALATAIGELERDQLGQANTFDASAVNPGAVAAAVEQLAERLTSGNQ